MTWVLQLARPEILALKPFAHALWEPGLERLHANELPWRPLSDPSAAGLNYYPEPQPRELVQKLAEVYRVPSESVLIGRGSDEAIDLLVRSFCRAGRDAILICPPTFGMYELCARIQGAEVLTAPLQKAESFALDVDTINRRCTRDVKVVFLCSPNNPTGNLLSESAILHLAQALEGRALLVVDEAYVEFAEAESLVRHIGSFPNLLVLRTLSKAYALAGARCGALLAHPDIIALLRKVIHPYALAQSSVEIALRILDPAQIAVAKGRWELIRAERERVRKALLQSSRLRQVWPSAANFVLASFDDSASTLRRAHRANLLIRDVGSYFGLGGCLRITIGTPAQNNRLLQALA